MTFIGHTLTGLTVGAAVLPGGMSRRRTIVSMAIFALLADVPDFPLPGWGHYDYRFSHSIFVNVALMVIVLAGLGLLRKWKDVRIPRRLIGAGAMAWCSHLLLDSMYNHGLGIAIFWPVSRESLVLPVPWFSVLESSPPPLNAHTLRVLAVELAFFVPLLAAVLVARRVLISKGRSDLAD